MMPDPGDAVEALIQRCLQGDQLAWEQIVRQYWRKVTIDASVRSSKQNLDGEHHDDPYKKLGSGKRL